MRIHHDQYIPALTSRVKDSLATLSKSRTASTCIVARATIVLLAAEGMQNKEISFHVDLHPNQVGKWRRKFIAEQSRLNDISNEQPEDLNKELIKILKDAPRKGKPRKITDDQRTFIITIACQNPSDYGFELSQWSLPSLQKCVIQQGIIDSISTASINRILNEQNLQPHKNRYWLHSTEKYEDPETYKAKVHAINEVYHYAEEIRQRAGDSNVHIYSTDEMTGIQALEHLHPDKLPLPGMQAKHEFEYIRHGTISLIGFYNVITGTVADPFLNPTRTETDFVTAFDQMIQTDPVGEWIIIADNLNTHISESLVLYVAEQIGYSDDLGKKGKSGILHTKETRAAFLTDPTHRIRFLFTPKHCSWMNQIEIWFGIINRQLLKRKSYTSVEDLVSSITRYIEQYNRMFAHPFNWRYNTTPLGN